jgi:FkbM family methyltransferase
MLLKYYQKLDDAISYLFSSTANEKKLLKKIFNNKQLVVIDIGANQGNFIGFLKNNFILKKIYVFEPIKELSEKIKLRFKSNKIIISNLAISNKKGQKKFYQYSVTSTSGLYKQNNTFKSLKELDEIFNVQTNKFDNLFNKNLKIDICKIDVQGEDYKVLLGMKQNLKKGNIKILKIELSLKTLYKDVSPNFYEILSYLRFYNYTLISVTKIKYKNNEIIFMDAYFKINK